MYAEPNPLLIDFLNKNIPLPEIHWETVPLGVNPADAWESFDENIAGWVPVWYPTYDPAAGRCYSEFERACMFNDSLESVLKTMNRWPLWGSPTQKKHAVAFALLHLFCEARTLCFQM